MKVSMLLLIMFAADLPLTGAVRKPGDKRSRDDDTQQPNNQFAADAPEQEKTYSVTLTPIGVTNDDEQMALCESIMHHMQADWLMRHADGGLRFAAMSRERGDHAREAHLQACYSISTTASTPEQMKRLAAAEKKHIKDLIANVTEYTIRLMHKTVHPRDKSYIIGYCTAKDEGLDHYTGFTIDLEDEEVETCKNVYRAKAAKNSFAGGEKMNKAPHQNQKLLPINVGNIFTLTSWFVEQHRLARLAAQLTLPIIVAYALSTLKYRIDENVITGRNGGNNLDVARSQALLQLSLTGPASHTRDIIPLVETILYGNGSERPTGVVHPDLPTTAQLIADYDLAAAKALCASLAEQDESSVTYIASAPLSITRFETPRATRGKYIVLDFMASSASINAARQMANAGLTGKSLVSTEQLENACGYLAAAWAYHLHRLDQKTTQNFDDITMEQARTYNRGTEIEKQNKYLNMGERGQTAAFLEVVDIMWLINEAEEENTYTPFYAEPSDWRNNDYWYDAEGNDEPTGIDWLDGVMAFNHWQVAFERSVAEPEEWGKVHIAVVNTVKANVLGPNAVGVHWIVIAWQVEGQVEGMDA